MSKCVGCKQTKDISKLWSQKALHLDLGFFWTNLLSCLIACSCGIASEFKQLQIEKFFLWDWLICPKAGNPKNPKCPTATQAVVEGPGLKSEMVNESWPSAKHLRFTWGFFRRFRLSFHSLRFKLHQKWHPLWGLLFEVWHLRWSPPSGGFSSANAHALRSVHHALCVSQDSMNPHSQGGRQI